MRHFLRSCAREEAVADFAWELHPLPHVRDSGNVFFMAARSISQARATTKANDIVIVHRERRIDGRWESDAPAESPL